MALNSQLYYLIPSSTSNIYSRQRHIGIRFFYKEVVSFDKVVCCCATNKQKHILGCRCSGFRKRWPLCQRAKRKPYFIQRASMDDEVMVNGVPQASSSGEMQELRLKLDQSLQGEDISTGLVQSLHDAARAIELAILEHSSSFKTSWISKAWLGVDKNAWVKTLSYQAAVYSLLQAAVEISSLGDGRDGDVNVFVQRSLLRQSGSLESVIREELSYNQPAAYDWFWSQQYPMVVATFVNLFQRDPCFRAATTICWKGMPSGSGSANDLSLLMLALSCIAAVTKLGPAKVSCPQFFSMVPDISGKLMDMLVDFVPVQKAYYSLKEIGLRREFLLHFGPRAAACRVLNDHDVEEMAFWIDLVQKQLQRAIDRERIWSRLTTCECIEVLEKDLAIFGFFIALGRSTQSFVSANGLSTMDNPIESIIRYFIGGSVLYYPQLSSISSYQLYVEVVCEELDWLPFYGTNVVATKAHHENQSQVQGLPYGEVISQILDVCSHWTKSFVKYSLWLENPSNIKAAKFLSRGHSKLKDCEQELFAPKNEIRESDEDEVERTKLGSYSYSMEEKGLDTFDKALENVDEAIDRLEGLLQELHLSNSSTGKEHLEAACSDLERIRKLKKEAEFLEASFRAKAASLEEGNNEEKTQPSLNKKRQYPKRRKENASSKRVSGGSTSERVGSRGLLEFLRRQSTKKMEPEYSTGNENLGCLLVTVLEVVKEDGTPKQVSDSDNCNKSSELSEIRRFEVLRCELIELEKRVQRSTVESYSDKDYNVLENRKTYVVVPGGQKLVEAPQKENIIAKSLDKLKETSTDVWQGTQLLAIDVVAATVLIKRALTGDELAEKEKKALQRTLTDLASVVPIGILMLLPVTAVGHAAMLAAIQRYVPALIPSTYGPERLDLLRQLEKVKEMETGEVKSDENEQ